MKLKLFITLAAGLIALSVITVGLAWSWIWTTRTPHRIDGNYSATELWEAAKLGQGIVAPSNPRTILGFHASRRFSNDPLHGDAVLWDAETGYRVWELTSASGAWIASFWSPDGKAIGALEMDAHPGYEPPYVAVPRREVPLRDDRYPRDQIKPTAPWVVSGSDAEEWWLSQHGEPR